MSDLETQWGRVQGRLKAEFGDAAFNSWLKPLALVNVESGRVHIAVPTRFMRDWVQSHYVDRIRDFWSIENPDVDGVEIRVASAMTPRPRPPLERPQAELAAAERGEPQSARAETSKPETSKSETAKPGRAKRGTADVSISDQRKADLEDRPVQQRVYSNGSMASGSLASGSLDGAPAFPAHPLHESDEGEDIGAPLDHRFTFDSFVVGKSNELAYAAARRVAENAAVNFNPLFLHGGVGLGKTHLMHAIAWHIRHRDPSRRVIYMSAEKFMYQFVSALRYKDTMAFKQKFRAVDVLMIDDVQFIANKNSTQEEFFHTFNALIDHHRQVVISADRSPSDLEGIEERIRSRLGWGLVADIHPTDYELRLGILQQKVDSMPGTEVPVLVMEFLARRISSNVRELEGAMNRIIAHATLIGRPITMEMTQEVLQDLLRANDRRVTIDDIQRKVAEYYNLRLADLLSARRARTVARPRQVAMFLSKQLTTRSLPDIGRKFGGRDHTTVIHAVKRVEELVQTDGALEEDIHHLRRMLEG